MESGIIFTNSSPEMIYQKLYDEAHQNSYTSYLRGKRCVDEISFFYEVSASFQFPWYFGENWAAFDECVCDLDWLCFSGIFIVVDDFSLTFNGNVSLQNCLIKYLGIMVEYWKSMNTPVLIWLNN